MQAPPARGPRTRTSKKYRHGNAEDRFRLVLIAFVFGGPQFRSVPFTGPRALPSRQRLPIQENAANRTAARACHALPPRPASGHAAFFRRRPVAIVFAFHPCPLFSGVGCKREAHCFLPMSEFHIARMSVKMQEPVALTERDRAILTALTRKVRLLTIAQIARTWWDGNADPERNAKRRLAELERSGLVRSISISAHPELPLPYPEFVWKPGEPEPEFAPLSYRLQSRWVLPASVVVAVVGTKLSANLFGGKITRLPREDEQNHDVHLGALYLRFLKLFPEQAEAWLSEELIRRTRPQRRGEKLPDALVELNGRKHVVEFGGAYSKDKLKRFHGFCRWKRYSYEIW